MRVLHYRNTFSPLSEIFIFDYINELEQSGVDNYVVTHNIVNQRSRPFEKIVTVNTPGRWNAEKIFNYLLRKIGRLDSSIPSWPIIRRGLEKAVKDINPDIIHAHFGPEGVKIAPVAKQLNIPLVTSFYGYDISTLKKEKFWIAEYQKLWEVTSAIMVLSNEMKESVCSINGHENKIHIVHLSRDIAQFNYNKSCSLVRKFVSVGRLTHKKGHFDTIDAFKKLIEVDYDIELEIIGGGDLRSELEDYIKSAGIEDSVYLVGALANEEVVKRMEVADAFILSSKTAPNGDKEGTPTVLVEAQAMELPCISTFHAGIPEMIPDTNHQFLAKEGNVSDIAQKIETLINCNTEQLKEIALRGRQHIEENFDLEKQALKAVELYNGIIA